MAGASMGNSNFSGSSARSQRQRSQPSGAPRSISTRSPRYRRGAAAAKAAASLSTGPITSDEVHCLPPAPVSSQSQPTKAIAAIDEEEASLRGTILNILDISERTKRSIQETIARAHSNIGRLRNDLWGLVDSIGILKETLEAHGVEYSQEVLEKNVTAIEDAGQPKSPQATPAASICTTTCSEESLSGSKRKTCESSEYSSSDDEADSNDSPRPYKKTRLEVQANELMAAIETYKAEWMPKVNALEEEERELEEARSTLVAEWRRLTDLVAAIAKGISTDVPAKMPGNIDRAFSGETEVNPRQHPRNAQRCLRSCEDEATSSPPATPAPVQAPQAGPSEEIQTDIDIAALGSDEMEIVDDNMLWSGFWACIPGANAYTLGAEIYGMEAEEDRVSCA